MAGKAFAGLIIAFWVTMMAALVRVEFFPQPVALNAVPTQQALKKIFSNPEPARLNVFYQDTLVGACNIEIRNQADDDKDVPAAVRFRPRAYEVVSELKMRLSPFNIPSNLRLTGDTWFNTNYEMGDFHIKTSILDALIEITGEKAKNKVRVSFTLGEKREERVLDFGQMQGAGLASAFGLPGLANFSFLGAGGMPSPFGVGAADSAAQPSTTTQLATLDVRGNALQVYLIESKFDQTMWAKIWVTELGEVLKVETSFGLTMLADVITPELNRKQRVKLN